MSENQRRQRILPRQTVRMRDGVGLCTDVYLTPREGRAPAALVRTPYGRNLPLLLRMALRLNAAGCSVVLQDCRGRYQSEGAYDWRREEDDTYDTLCWLAQQPWSNGDVGLCGMSITAHSNFLLAAGGMPPGIEVKAMVSIMGSVSYYAMCYRDGALVLHWALPWALMMEANNMGRTHWHQLPWPEVFRHLPLESIPEAYGSASDTWDLMISSPRFRGMWKELDVGPRIAGLAIPTLHLSGWADFMLHHTLSGYQSMAPEGESPSALQKLVIGPWDHGTLFESFGASSAPAQAAPAGGVDLLELVAVWFGRWLADGGGSAGAEIESEPSVMLRLTGDGWVGARRYPLAEAETEDWYLVSSGRAHRDLEDGRLVRERPSRLGRDTFSYDPDDPVPTRGGAVWPFPAAGLAPGMADQTEIEERPDVVVYSSDPLTEDLFVVGPLSVELWAATSASDTDFTAKLVDVDPLGVPRIVQDGAVRGRFHRSLQDEELLEPHRPYLFTISMQATAMRLRRGHRLRLEVSSSNFPKLDRNLNTAAPGRSAASAMIARQTVFHGAEMASRLKLPVVPRDRIEAMRCQPSASWRVT